MGTFDVVLLSSSPPASSLGLSQSCNPPHVSQQRAEKAATAPAPTSSHPSPKNKDNGASRSGSKAVAIPEGAARGFTTASSLVRLQQFTLETEEAPVCGRQNQSQTDPVADLDKAGTGPKKAGNKTTAVAVTKETPETRERKRRSCKFKVATGVVNAVPLCNSVSTFSPYFVSGPAAVAPMDPVATKSSTTKNPAKPRKAQVKREKSNKEADTKVRSRKPKTKDSNGTTDGAVNMQRTTGDVGEAGQTNVKIADNAAKEVSKNSSSREGCPFRKASPIRELHLEEAVSRRRDWTPPRESTYLDHIGDEIDKRNVPTVIENGNGSFTSILSVYSYAQSDPPRYASAQTAFNEPVVSKKKRRIDLVNIPNGPAERCAASPQKGRAPKKKARTITELVIGQYAPMVDRVDHNDAPNALFGPRIRTAKVPLNDVSTSTDSNSKKACRGRSKTKSQSCEKDTKPKKVSRKAATAATPNVIMHKLLSPTSALSRLNKQDVLFGTSSQLALDESPRTIRAIQQAIQQSEEELTTIVEDPVPERSESPTMQSWPRLGKVAGRRGLWAASARDEDGLLLLQQQGNDNDSSEPDCAQDLPRLDGTCHIPDTVFAASHEYLRQTITISSDLPTPPETVVDMPLGQIEARRWDDRSFQDIDDFASEINLQSKQQAEPTFNDIDELALRTEFSVSPSKKGRSPSGSSTSQRMQSPKSPSMLLPLSQKVPTVPKPQRTAHIPSLPGTPPRQRRFIDIEEILDSEDDEALSPTPPRSSQFQKPLPLILVPSRPIFVPPPEDLVRIFKVKASQLQWESIKTSIFAEITSFLHSLPPTTDPAHPSWFEKILMYDAIVLEDFTACLNADTSIRTFKRATQKQIKAYNKYCNMSGKEVLEVDEGEDHVLVIEKMLEPYMTQAWCQEMSVCCIMREKPGKGGVRKGLY